MDGATVKRGEYQDAPIPGLREGLRRVLVSRPTRRRPTPITATALHFEVRLDSEGAVNAEFTFHVLGWIRGPPRLEAVVPANLPLVLGAHLIAAAQRRGVLHEILLRIDPDGPAGVVHRADV